VKLLRLLRDAGHVLDRIEQPHAPSLSPPAVAGPARILDERFHGTVRPGA
jgi:hypothetical protein